MDRRRPCATQSSRRDDVRRELLSCEGDAEFASAGQSRTTSTLSDGQIVADRFGRRRLHRRCDASLQSRAHRAEKSTSSRGSKHAHNTHSAVFAEVKVDEQLGVIRVTRVVNAVAAGRILNTKTARSQIMGGVVWGSAWRCTRRPCSITIRPHHERQHRRIPCPGECGRA